MKTLGNILWHFPFFGFVSAILVFLLGALLTVTIIAAPIGLGLIQYSKIDLIIYFLIGLICAACVPEKRNAQSSVDKYLNN